MLEKCFLVLDEYFNFLRPNMTYAGRIKYNLNFPELTAKLHTCTLSLFISMEESSNDVGG